MAARNVREEAQVNGTGSRRRFEASRRYVPAFNFFFHSSTDSTANSKPSGAPAFSSQGEKLAFNFYLEDDGGITQGGSSRRNASEPHESNKKGVHLRFQKSLEAIIASALRVSGYNCNIQERRPYDPYHEPRQRRPSSKARSSSISVHPPPKGAETKHPADTTIVPLNMLYLGTSFDKICLPISDPTKTRFLLHHSSGTLALEFTWCGRECKLICRNLLYGVELIVVGSGMRHIFFNDAEFWERSHHHEEHYERSSNVQWIRRFEHAGFRFRAVMLQDVERFQKELRQAQDRAAAALRESTVNASLSVTTKSDVSSRESTPPCSDSATSFDNSESGSKISDVQSHPDSGLNAETASSETFTLRLQWLSIASSWPASSTQQAAVASLTLDMINRKLNLEFILEDSKFCILCGDLQRGMILKSETQPRTLHFNEAEVWEWEDVGLLYSWVKYDHNDNDGIGNQLLNAQFKFMAMEDKEEDRLLAGLKCIREATWLVPTLRVCTGNGEVIDCHEVNSNPEDDIWDTSTGSDGEGPYGGPPVKGVLYDPDSDSDPTTTSDSD